MDLDKAYIILYKMFRIAEFCFMGITAYAIYKISILGGVLPQEEIQETVSSLLLMVCGLMWICIMNIADTMKLKIKMSEGNINES